MDKSKEQEVVNYYQKILTVLGYEFKDEMIQQTYEKVKNCISEHIEFLNFHMIFCVKTQFNSKSFVKSKFV